jgi:hypothetical protein
MISLASLPLRTLAAQIEIPLESLIFIDEVDLSRVFSNVLLRIPHIFVVFRIKFSHDSHRDR